MKTFLQWFETERGPKPDLEIEGKPISVRESDLFRWEKEAYEAGQADAKASLEIAITALTFYANRESWVFSYSLNRGINYREIVNTDTYGMPHPDNERGQFFGGKTARKALNIILNGIKEENETTESDESGN